MGRSAAPRDAEAPLSWYGAEPPDDGGFGADDDPWSDDDELAMAAAARSRRLRSMAVLGVGGLLLAAVVVTGVGANDGGDRPEEDAVPTTVVDAAAESGNEAAPADLDPDVVAIEGGLRYGGMGGGADIRRSAAPPTDRPFTDPDSMDRLPDSVDTSRWSVVLPVAGAEVSTSSSRSQVAVVGDAAIVLTDVGGTRRLAALAIVDGTEVWSADAGTGPIRLDVASDDVLALRSIVDGVPTTDWRSVADGSRLDSDSPEVVAAMARSAGTDTVAVDPAAVDSSIVEVGPGMSGRALEVATGVADGSIPLLAAELVALDRLVGFVGDALVGLRLAQPAQPVPEPGLELAGPLTVEWVQPGVLIFAGPNERGSSLLVSNLRGDEQYVVDAASGDTITELAWLASPEAGFTLAGNGVVVRQPAAIGSALVATDLDGAELWRITGSPAFAVGDGLVVTASPSPDGVVVTAWS